jgi:hypothetical protein
VDFEARFSRYVQRRSDCQTARVFFDLSQLLKLTAYNRDFDGNPLDLKRRILDCLQEVDGILVIEMDV